MILSLSTALLLLAGMQGGTAGTPEPTKMPVEKTAAWAVLSDGRVKPLETLAEETMMAIAERHVVEGFTALDVLWGAHLDWERYSKVPIIKINGSDLKEHLGLDTGERRFSYTTLISNPAFQGLVEAGLALERAGGESVGFERDALAVYQRMERLVAMQSGVVLTLVPQDPEVGTWRTVDSLKDSQEPAEAAVYQGFRTLAEAWSGGHEETFAVTADALTTQLREVLPDHYPAQNKLDRELLYNSMNSFGYAWKVYLLGFLILALMGRSERRSWYRAGLVLIGLGFLWHTAGLALRWLIAGRAPVSDMYESLVFMGWGVIAIGLILEYFYRRGFFGIAAGLMGFIALAFAENLPIDSSINPLVPVLANTSWLSIHVMTIMLSYSAFALAMAMGHIVLFLQFFRPGRTKQLRSLSTLLYKTLQVGVLFLAAGIAFGAIWANESWGRYWGWDPKETWSLITFFVYMIVVHARFAGWVSHFGLAVSSIASFLAVLMTYYGVNFILGSGLHSYGDSKGGMIWVMTYLGVEMLIIAASLLRYRAAYRPSPSTP